VTGLVNLRDYSDRFGGTPQAGKGSGFRLRVGDFTDMLARHPGRPRVAPTVPAGIALPMTDDTVSISPAMLDAARRGDETAWRQLVEALYPLVAGIIRNHLRRVADREDVAQEVFVKIFANLGQYGGHQPFDHWVSRITLNACHDWLRRIAARPVVNYSDLAEEEREILERTLADETISQDHPPGLLHELLDRLIATLSPREQIVIRLLDLDQNSVEQVCNLTGWGTSKVKATAMRARRKLAAQMKKLELPTAHPPP
jgi:RNA polymerase sigma-70 factor (ECF subfamily)